MAHYTPVYCTSTGHLALAVRWRWSNLSVRLCRMTTLYGPEKPLQAQHLVQCTLLQFISQRHSRLWVDNTDIIVHRKYIFIHSLTILPNMQHRSTNENCSVHASITSLLSRTTLYYMRQALKSCIKLKPSVTRDNRVQNNFYLYNSIN